MVIELQDVTKTYGADGQTFRALDGVSVVIEPGEFASIVGPSGSGKSTLLNMMAGLDAPTTGQVFVKGHDLARLSDAALSDLRLREIGFVFQSFNLFPALTVADNVAWPLEFAGVKRARIRAAVSEALAAVGMARREARRPAELSGGEQQRVAIARALINRPSIILADEPTGNLDSRTGDSILELMRIWEEHRKTVLMVTHRSDAVSWGSRTIEMCDGQVRSAEREAIACRG